jgi:AcrR family transcriptional regulator
MSRHEPDSEPTRGGRDFAREIREAAQAGREAVRQAKEAAREAAREDREAVRTAGRERREALHNLAQEHRDALRERQEALREARGRAEPGEPGTRARLQQVALELFAEHGYEATSLREIAERLGVTKAALYYHFKSKDEIIASLMADQLAMVEQLIEWTRTQPRTVETRREFVRRYSAALHERDHQMLMRFMERNQSSMQQLKAGSTMRERMVELLDALSPPDASLPDQIRYSLAIFALHSTWFTVRDPDISDDQRREAALEVAMELVGRPES